MKLTALAAAWVGGLLLGQQAALPLEALVLWSIAGAALWSAVALHTGRQGLVAIGCACALLLPAGVWWGDRTAQLPVDEAPSPLFVEERVTLRGVVLTDPERDANRVPLPAWRAAA